MNGKNLLIGLSYIDRKYIEESEQEMVTGKNSGIRSLRRPLLIAAAAALMLLLVGCAVAYMLRLKEIKLGQQQTSYDSFIYDPDTGVPVEYLGKETVTEQALSFAGVKDTPAFQAAQEWFDFKQAYDPDGQIQRSVWGHEPEFPGEYCGYGLYTQQMRDKLDELLEKYDLKLRGAPVPFRTPKQLLRAMGMTTFLNAGSQDSMRIDHAAYYENGNLDLFFFLTCPGKEPVENTFCCLYYRQKDCLIDEFATIGVDSGWREWNYKTTSGDELLIVRSEGSYVWLFCDTGSRTAALRLESTLTDQQVKLAADAIDFSLEPKLLDGYERLDEGAAGSGADIDGYSVKLKSAQTDGYSVYIIISVTAPEGVDLEGKSAGALDLQLIDTETSGYRGGWQTADDGDGRANTCDMVLERSYSPNDGHPAITKDTVANIYWEDIFEESGDSWEQDTLVLEGVWNFDVTFEGSDFREIQLLSEPIRAKACIGWRNGSDVLETSEVTSVKLRSLGIELESENKNADFFSFTGASSYAVMKDGSRVEIRDKAFVTPIHLDEVDHILLADGTKLDVPELNDATTLSLPQT